MHLFIDEVEPLRQRYVHKTRHDLKHGVWNDGLEWGEYSVRIQAEPFYVSVSRGKLVVWEFNKRGWFHFEHYRTKGNFEQEVKEEAKEDEKQENELRKRDEEDWTETFGQNTDSNPYGPASLGLDITLGSSSVLYGVPEHGSSLALQSTQGKEPYRLYNLDVFEYILDSPMALYGSVPFVMGHGVEGSVGVLFMNSAEQWVDVDANAVHWTAESGVIDLYVFVGSVSQSLSRVTGRSAMPQLFAVGYHQCRWNYNDQQDVKSVDAGFDSHDVPYDVLWLDIEHTNGKRYFTWDGLY